MKFKTFFCLGLFLLLIPKGLFAADFIALVGIPGLEQVTGPGSLNQYINALYRLSISIAALLAVIKIVVAGAKYMLSDIVTHKEDAKKDIQGALIGLLIVIGAIIILNTVNTDLTKLNLAVPVQEITQGEKLEKLIYDAVTAACDKPGRAVACELITCEGWIYDDVETEGNEDVVDACRRTCLEDAQGAFEANLYTPYSSTCRYDPEVAINCDPNNSWTCCEKIQGGSWNSTHKICSGTGPAFKVIQCSYGGDCIPEVAECLKNGTMVRPPVNILVGRISSKSFVCSDNTQTLINE